jgi:putative oxidoreductase
MKELLNNKYFIFILRVGAGLFFIYAAQSKILNTEEFGQAIRAYDIIPDSLSTIPAIILPWVELYCGILLVAGFYTRSSATIAAGLLILFTINIFIALLRGLEIDCGCGASVIGVEHVSWIKILENCFFILILYLISSRDSFFLSIDSKRIKK